MKLILASQSPRRAQLLAEAGFRFEILAADEHVEQDALAGGGLNFPPEQLVVQLALLKAKNVAHRLQKVFHDSIDKNSGEEERIVILAADTVAVCCGQILGKPGDRDDAGRMLRLMSGQIHEVMTGVCLMDVSTGHHEERLEVTRLRMDFLSETEIESYLDSSQWMGKAGAFGYQDGLNWVHIIEGLESNVVGLPVERLGDWLGKNSAHHPK